MNDYQRGTKDAWELARKICLWDDDCYSFEELEKIFGARELKEIMEATYDEAKEKIDKWKREQYKVGDIIEYAGEKAYVTKVDGYLVYYLQEDGLTGGFVIDKHDATWKVTGHLSSIVYYKKMGIWC